MLYSPTYKNKTTKLTEVSTVNPDPSSAVSHN